MDTATSSLTYDIPEVAQLLGAQTFPRLCAGRRKVVPIIRLSKP